MSDTNTGNWLDANKMATDALAAAKTATAVHRAHTHLIMLMLTTIAKSAPKDAVDQLLQELERVRDLSGPAGAAGNEVFAQAVSTLERFARRE